MTKHYDKNRCYQTLDEQGGYYCRHTRALTVEDLRGKHEIAAELGYRDSVIDGLRAELNQCKEALKLAMKHLATGAKLDSRVEHSTEKETTNG